MLLPQFEMTTPVTAAPPIGSLSKLVTWIARALAVAMTSLVAAGVLTPPSACADLGTTPTVVDRALRIMANRSTPLPQRRRQLRDAIESNFDFTQMSRSALGYHWRSLSPEQRVQFSQLFKAFIEDAYLSKIQDYSGQQVVFTGQTPLGQGYVQINSKIVQPGRNPIAVNYLMLQTNGSWKIYDVTVDAISIIANYRNQFNRVINEKGIGQLLADLRAKQEELASQLGGH
jgi:phospholipid transport system substrate-binding protein